MPNEMSAVSPPMTMPLTSTPVGAGHRIRWTTMSPRITAPVGATHDVRHDERTAFVVALSATVIVPPVGSVANLNSGQDSPSGLCPPGCSRRRQAGAEGENDGGHGRKAQGASA